MPLLSLLLLAAGASAPSPGPIKTFGNWEVACDNARRCEMTSLIPDDDTGDYGDFSIVREPGPTGGIIIQAAGPRDVGGHAEIAIDGKIVGGGTMKDKALTLTGEVARRVVAAMADGTLMTLTDGAKNGHASLAGSAAALRFIDAEQGRAGTVTAAVAKGTGPASAVPAPVALPHVVAIRAVGVAAAVTPALIHAMIPLSKCDADDTRTNDPITGEAIGGGATLVLLPCGAGAYNVNTVPFVVVAGKPALARFDVPTDVDSDVPSLTNADWDPKSATLSTHAKGRGIGDCGTGEEYVWDGRSFRLVNQVRMDECRGSVNWLTVWRAEVDRR
jgi:hypothetical protein